MARAAALWLGGALALVGRADGWVSLNAAKIAHRQGLVSSIACNKPGEARKMLWGPDVSSEDEAKIKVVEGAEGIGEILEDAEGLIISGAGFAGLTANYCETVLRNAPECKSVAICVEAGKNGDAIEAARKACAERSIPCSVLRVHELRGGGPGTEKGEEMEDLGLSRQFYDTQFDFPKFQADSYADKFLLGVSVRTRRPSYRELHAIDAVSHAGPGRRQARELLPEDEGGERHSKGRRDYQ